MSWAGSVVSARHFSPLLENSKNFFYGVELNCRGDEIRECRRVYANRNCIIDLY